MQYTQIITRSFKVLMSAVFALNFSIFAYAQNAEFSMGPVFESFAPTASVETDFKISKRAKFKILFDTAKAADPGDINRTLETAGRFINMHVKAGVPIKNIKIAVVVHSKAGFDLTSGQTYGARYDGAENVNADVIKALTENGVRIILCGQSAAFYGIKNDNLLPNVEMALSAMTAHAVLQQDGYTLNPF